jgi:hypothetical protein
LPEWYSIAGDIGLFLGDLMIERHPILHWEFFTWGKSSIAYQQPVIMGFGTEDPKSPSGEVPPLTVRDA